MAAHDAASNMHGYPVYSGAQRLLRFVSLLYLAWYVLLASAGIAAALAHLLMGFDVSAASGGMPPVREVAIANAVIFAIDIAFNLLVAISAWLAANHPVIARRFRIFAGVLVALSIVSVGYAAFFGQLANAFSGLYSVFITGLLFYLSSQVAREYIAGSAVDFSELATAASGRRLRTERQIERALERGELPERQRLQ